MQVTASIGIAYGRYETPDELLRDADIALYQAKGSGKDRYVLFSASAELTPEVGVASIPVGSIKASC